MTRSRATRNTSRILISATALALLAAGALAEPQLGVSRRPGPDYLPPVGPSRSTLVIGGPLSLGGDGSFDPATLSDGSLADGQVDFFYDPFAFVLTVVVNNNSTTSVGNTPVLGELYINVPLAVAIDDVQLVAQVDALGNDPGYTLVADTDPFDTNQLNDTGVLGQFSMALIPAPGSGIASPGSIGTPPAAVQGPVTFIFELIGQPLNLVQLSAEYPKRLYSIPSMQGTTALLVNGAANFWNAGDGTGGGTVSDTTGDCNPIAFWSGDNRIGHTQILFLQATVGCHGCYVYSHVFGASNLPGVPIQLDIGGPTNELFVFLVHTFFVNGFEQLPFDIPNDTSIIGETRHWQFVSNPVTGITDDFELSPVVTTTFLP